jgi:hypothetical protein
MTPKGRKYQPVGNMTHVCSQCSQCSQSSKWGLTTLDFWRKSLPCKGLRGRVVNVVNDILKIKYIVYRGTPHHTGTTPTQGMVKLRKSLTTLTTNGLTPNTPWGYV